MKRLLVVALGLMLTLATLTGPAWAWQAKGGSINCGHTIAYTQATFHTYGEIRPPGSSTIYAYSLASGWHTRTRYGGYSGSWYALGDPQLNMNQTYARCSSFG